MTLRPGRRRIEFLCAAFGLQPGIYAVGASIRERRGAGAIDWWYGTRMLYVEPGKSVRGLLLRAARMEVGRCRSRS